MSFSQLSFSLQSLLLNRCVSTRFRRRIPVLLYQEDGGDEQKDAEGRAQNILPDEGDVGVEEDYSVMTRLREEAESPFRSLRFLIYGGVGASGAIGALTALTGALAAFSGVRGAVPLSESGKDIAIDLGAIGLAALLWNLDSQTKARKLGRLSRGAKIASLKVQVQDGGGAGERPVLSLADFRRDRGMARRVVIFAGGEDVVQAALNTAGEAGMKERLIRNAFLVVPLVLPADGEDNPSVLGLAQERLQGAQDEPHVGWPLLLREWQDYLAAEAAAARKQGIDPVQQGISVVLKLNGRVGQRAFGKPAWERLVGDVERRRRRGLDVTNI